MAVLLRTCAMFALLILWVSSSSAQPSPNPRPQPVPPNANNNALLVALPPAPATTVQLPTFGVSVDANGVLQRKVIEDPTGQLAKRQRQAALEKLPRDVQAKSALRKVSLVRLEKAIQAALAANQQPDDAMRRLAGLQRVQYVFLYPDTKDIVLAGPAEGWTNDPAGRPLGLSTGRPVLELADLLAALRAYPPGRVQPVFVGCTIEPTEDGLTRLRQAQAKIPASVRQDQQVPVAQETARLLHEALGNANIRVFGVSANTHFAAVLIEADYRMKLIGIGLETPPLKLNSFLDLATGGQHGTLQRWWFTPNYDCIRAVADRTACEFVGQGVQLQSENKVIGPDGQIMAAAQTNRQSDMFTDGFTKRFPELAVRSPIFAQLRNLIDLTMVAAWLQQERYYDKADWRPTTLLDEQALPIKTEGTPKTVPVAVNVVWKGNRMLALSGGGVSIRADQAFAKEHLLPDDGDRVRSARQRTGEKPPAERWWWD